MTTRALSPQHLEDLFERNRAKHVARVFRVAWKTAREYVYEGVPQRHRQAAVQVIDDVIRGLEARRARLVALREALNVEEAAGPGDPADRRGDRRGEGHPPPRVGEPP